MIKKLLIVFASGLMFAVVALSAAWVIGGDAMIKRIHDEGGFAVDFDDDDDKPRSTRNFAFDASQTLTLDTPVSLRFVRGDKAEMTVSGPADFVNALQFEGGHLALAKGSAHRNKGLKITITAPGIAGLVLNAPGEINLANLDQPSLSVDARGAIDLDASGKVEKLVVKTSGAGNLDLQDVEAKHATVQIDGVGNIDLAATGTVDAGISGAGNISLHRKPEVLTSRISGIGSIDHDY